MTAAVMEDKDALRSSFERFAAAHAGSDPAWLRERRTAAFARHVEKGLPGPRDEGWRHTPTAGLTRTRFEPADPRAVADLDLPGLVPRGALRGLEAVFVNGRLVPSLSHLEAAGAKGVRIVPLREAAGSSEAREHLGRVVPDDGCVFADLNTAFAEDAAVVLISPGAVVQEPIHLLHLSVPGEAPTVSYARSLVIAGRGSESRLVESYAGPDGRPYLLNAVTELLLADGARVDRAKLQVEGGEALHVSSLACRLGRDAVFADRAFSLGAALSRNDIDLCLDGEGAEGILDGLFALDGRRVADTHSRIDHARPHGTSRQLYKGILDDASRGVFDGLVRVRPGAQKTDAAQANRNLLLSRESLVHSNPRLEIRADDVKCKHGSTTGQLDPEALFYLRARGLGEAAARSLLTWAFAGDLLREVTVEPVRRVVERRLQAHLPGVAELREALS